MGSTSFGDGVAAGKRPAVCRKRRRSGPESQRFRYTAWSADYGNELTLLLGGCVDQGILESQVRQYVRDALLACPYIREVDGFSFSKKGSRVEARFTVHTVYEEFTQKTEVSIR